MPGPHLSGKPWPHLCFPPACVEMSATPSFPTTLWQRTNRMHCLTCHSTLGFLSTHFKNCVKCDDYAIPTVGNLEMSEKSQLRDWVTQRDRAFQNTGSFSP